MSLSLNCMNFRILRILLIQRDECSSGICWQIVRSYGSFSPVLNVAVTLPCCFKFTSLHIYRVTLASVCNARTGLEYSSSALYDQVFKSLT